MQSFNKTEITIVDASILNKEDLHLFFSKKFPEEFKRCKDIVYSLSDSGNLHITTIIPFTEDVPFLLKIFDKDYRHIHFLVSQLNDKFSERPIKLIKNEEKKDSNVIVASLLAQDFNYFFRRLNAIANSDFNQESLLFLYIKWIKQFLKIDIISIQLVNNEIIFFTTNGNYTLQELGLKIIDVKNRIGGSLRQNIDTGIVYNDLLRTIFFICVNRSSNDNNFSKFICSLDVGSKQHILDNCWSDASLYKVLDLLKDNMDFQLNNFHSLLNFLQKNKSDYDIKNDSFYYKEIFKLYISSLIKNPEYITHESLELIITTPFRVANVLKLDTSINTLFSYVRFNENIEINSKNKFIKFLESHGINPQDLIKQSQWERMKFMFSICHRDVIFEIFKVMVCLDAQLLQNFPVGTQDTGMDQVEDEGFFVVSKTSVVPHSVFALSANENFFDGIISLTRQAIQIYLQRRSNIDSVDTGVNRANSYNNLLANPDISRECKIFLIHLMLNTDRSISLKRDINSILVLQIKKIDSFVKDYVKENSVQLKSFQNNMENLIDKKNVDWKKSSELDLFYQCNKTSWNFSR